MDNITNLANEFHSDKGTVWSYKHRYSCLYDLLFWHYRDAPINFLELGLAVGGPDSIDGRLERTVASPSVAMWLAYFHKARIFGFDISDFSHIRHERFTFVQGDAGARSDLESVAGAASHFDIIIDDASHASYHQQLAFKTLWPRLAAGGIYIIEDLHWQSDLYEETMPRVPLTRDFLVKWFEHGHYEPNVVLSHDEMVSFASEIETFAAFPAFNDGGDPAYRRPDNSAKLIVMRKRAE